MFDDHDLQCRMAEAMQNKLGEMMPRKIQAAKTIVICGINPTGQKIMELLTSIGRNIDYFTSFHIDVSIPPNHIPTISFHELTALPKEETLICIAEAENVLIINALIHMQFTQYIDFTWLQYPALFDPALIEKNMSAISATWELLCDDASKETFVSVLEYRLTGDPLRLRIAEWPQYFHPMVKPRKKDIIIDGGAFIGDTAWDFARYLDKNCTIFSFEPGVENYQALLETIKHNGLGDVVIPVQAGLWEETGQLVFDDSLGSGARINEGGTSLIGVVDLNFFIQHVGITPTLIKLDVEGAESKVLQGAEDFITRQLPRLQVCVYHLPADLWEIPLCLQRLSEKYRIFMGHHWLGQAGNWNFCETVAYATAE